MTSVDLLKVAGWALEGALGVYVTIAAWKLWAGNKKELRSISSLPNGDEIFARIPPAGTAGWPIGAKLIAGLRARHTAGRLQNEGILQDLEERIFSRDEIYRDISAGAILVALFFTFLTLWLTLEPDSDTFRTAVGLVGVNWPGIAAGGWALICGVVARKSNRLLFDAYGAWLDSQIFPFVAAGSTDSLNASLKTFNEIAGSLSGALMAMATLPAQLKEFQTGALSEMAGAIAEGLKQVRVGLSEETVRALKEAAGHSRVALERMEQRYASLLLLTEGQERRQVEIAAAIGNASQQLQGASGSLEGFRTSTERLVEVSAGISVKLDAVGELLPEAKVTMEAVRTELAAGSGAAYALREALVNTGALNEKLSENITKLSSDLTANSAKVEHQTGCLEAVAASLDSAVIHLGKFDSASEHLAIAVQKGAETLGAAARQFNEAVATVLRDGIEQVQGATAGAAKDIAEAAHAGAGQIASASSSGAQKIEAEGKRLSDALEHGTREVQYIVAGGTEHLAAAVREGAGRIVQAADNFTGIVQESSAKLLPDWKAVKIDIGDAIARVDETRRAHEQKIAEVGNSVRAAASDVQAAARRMDSAAATLTKDVGSATATVTKDVAEAKKDIKALTLWSLLRRRR